MVQIKRKGFLYKKIQKEVVSKEQILEVLNLTSLLKKPLLF